ncbi:hypothetical protein AVEN_112513-1, partial [Araneus ventricosus]
HFGDYGDKTKLLENTKCLTLSLLGAEVSRTIERLIYDIASCWKKYKKQALKPGVGQLHFGQQYKLVS